MFSTKKSLEPKMPIEKKLSWYDKIGYYKNFLLKSTNKHGVHSPFVFHLVTHCFYDKAYKPVYAKINWYKKKAGYKSIDKKDKILSRITSYFSPESVLLIGDHDPILPLILKQTLIKNKVLYTLSFEKNIPQELDIAPDFICIDLFNKPEFSIDAFLNLIDIAHNDTVVICNGLYKSKESRALWLELKKLSEVTVSLNIYYFGLLFFRKEQAKEHFVIRV